MDSNGKRIKKHTEKQKWTIDKNSWHSHIHQNVATMRSQQKNFQVPALKIVRQCACLTVCVCMPGMRNVIWKFKRPSGRFFVFFFLLPFPFYFAFQVRLLAIFSMLEYSILKCCFSSPWTFVFVSTARISIRYGTLFWRTLSVNKSEHILPKFFSIHIFH